MVHVIIIPSAKAESVSCVIFTFLASKSVKIEVKQAPINNKLMPTNKIIFFFILVGVLICFILNIADFHHIRSSVKTKWSASNMNHAVSFCQ